MLVVGTGTGGGGMSQTPWVTDIDGGNKNLFNVASIATGPVTVTGSVNSTGPYLVNGVPLPGQTPWLQNINAANFNLSNVANLSAGIISVASLNVTSSLTVNGQPLPGQTPWLQNINGGNFILSNVASIASNGNITANGNVNITGNYQINGVSIPTALTPWTSNVNAAGFRLLNLGVSLGVGIAVPSYAVDVAGDVNITGTFRVNGTAISQSNVVSVFGRVGNVVQVAGDYNAAQVTNAVSSAATYANPPWITSLAWSKITGTPTPAPYVLPPATTTTLGGVIVGAGLSVDGTGLLSTLQNINGNVTVNGGTVGSFIYVNGALAGTVANLPIQINGTVMP
jgi:hypothetical protein